MFRIYPLLVLLTIDHSFGFSPQLVHSFSKCAFHDHNTLSFRKSCSRQNASNAIIAHSQCDHSISDKHSSSSWNLRSLLNRIKALKDGVQRHHVPVFGKGNIFREGNVADRITLLGVVIDMTLSVIKLFGGIVFHSTVLIADAGHSLSDLFSDFITLWGMRLSRIPADRDRPYGHGKFQSIGSLLLSLTLIFTGISVGFLSYNKMTALPKLHWLIGSLDQSPTNVNTMAANLMPSWPAVILAALSIFAKEWLFRITRRVGDQINSQLLIANTWHHRSDAFSSILSMISILIAIISPKFASIDAAAGMVIACMILYTGIGVLIESIRQLTGALDEKVMKAVFNLTSSIEGIHGIKTIRARSAGSSSLVDMTIFTDIHLSSSAAHALAEKVRWTIIHHLPNVSDVLVRTQAVDTQRNIKQYVDDMDVASAYDTISETPELQD